MASRKTYLYGLGTGLIAGAILLQLGSIGQSASGMMQGDELEAAAAASGYVLKDARVAWYNESEVEAMIAEAVEKARAEAEAEAAPPAAPEADQTEPAERGTPAEPASPEGEPAKIYAFTIAPGTELTTVAKLLYELGLVSDYNGFLLEMEERKLAGKIQAKHYRFDAVPTTEELIEALTTP